MSTVALNTSSRRVLADVVPASMLAQVALIVGGAALVGILAQISIPLGFTPVPITGQTLGVLLVGSALGWRRASISMSFYLLAGLAGVPWFANHAHGVQAPLLGYLVGFIFSSALLGALASRGNDRTIVRAALSMVAAELVIYAFGVTWLSHNLHVSLATGFNLGMRPFIWGDIIKAVFAGVAFPTAWRIVKKADATK